LHFQKSPVIFAAVYLEPSHLQRPGLYFINALFLLSRDEAARMGPHVAGPDIMRQ
jgi:hypothetical protein